MRVNNPNPTKKGRYFKDNNSFDLWDFEGATHFENNKEMENQQIQPYTSYKPQLSIPNKSKTKKKTSSVEIDPKIKYKQKPNNKQSSVQKKVTPDIIIENNPDKMVKFIKNKFTQMTSQGNNDSVNQPKMKKTNKELEEIGANLYQKKVLSNDYEMQKEIKKKTDEQKSKQELSQCTFKPKLCANRVFDSNTSKNIIKKNLYEQQNKWLDSVNSKNVKNFEKKMTKELKDCSFNPQTTKMPNFATKSNQHENETTELYYMRIKNARKLSQERKDKVDYAKNYDKRKKKAVNKSCSVSNLEVDNFSKHINQLTQQEGLNADNNFEMKKNMLMQDLHGWNCNNTEVDDFF